MFINPSHEYCIKCPSRFNVHDMIDHGYDMKMYSMKYECIMFIYTYIHIIYIYIHICIHNYIYIIYIYILSYIYIYNIILYIYYILYIMCKSYKCVVHHDLEAIWDPTVSLTRSTLSTLSTAFSLDSSSFSFRPKLFALKADRHRKENSWDDMQQPRLFNQDGKRLDSARKQRIQTEYCSVLHPANAMSKSDLPTCSKESEHIWSWQIDPPESRGWI